MLKGFLFMGYTQIVTQSQLFPVEEESSSRRDIAPRAESEKAKKGRPINDLTGQRFGMLTVEELTGEMHTGQAVFVCRCDCGHFIRATRNHLIGSALPLTHCGCKGVTKSKKIRPGSLGIGAYNSIARTKNNPNVAFNGLYANYRQGAASRGLEWQLSEGEFLLLIQGSCNYCGAEPEQTYKTLVHTLPYNGVDRIDSSQGYHIENCVSCCGVCNRAKLDYDVDEFLEWVEKVHSYQERIKSCR